MELIFLVSVSNSSLARKSAMTDDQRMLEISLYILYFSEMCLSYIIKIMLN